MAVYNEILEGGLNRQLVQRLGMTASTPAASLAPEVAPSYDLFYNKLQPELEYPSGWRRFAHALKGAAVAAQRNHFRLRVVPNANALVVVEGIWIDPVGSVAAEFLVDISSFAADLANPFPFHVATDFRQKNVPSGTMAVGDVVILSTLTDASANTLGVFYDGIPPQGGLEVPGFPVVLDDGMGVEVDVSNVNAAATVQFLWRTRAKLPLEKA